MEYSPAVAAAGFWVALHLLLIWALGLRATQLRIKLKIGTGFGDSPELERAIRAHGNATEYVPALLVGLALVSLQSLPGIWVHALGGVLFVARLLHAHGIQDRSKPLPPTRVLGNILTWLVTLSIAGVLIWAFLATS